FGGGLGRRRRSGSSSRLWVRVEVWKGGRVEGWRIRTGSPVPPPFHPSTLPPFHTSALTTTQPAPPAQRPSAGAGQRPSGARTSRLRRSSVSGGPSARERAACEKRRGASGGHRRSQ